MGVKLNLSGLESAIRREAEKKAKRNGLNIECPNCGYRSLMFHGANQCPVCNRTIKLNIDFSK